MPDARPTLLLTRPEGASARFAAMFRARFGDDWPVVTSPLMQTVWLAPPVPLPTQAPQDLIFTSETAVLGWCRLTADRRGHAWCVGQRTGDAARRAGFSVTEGPGAARGLAQAIATARPRGGLLWPSGRDIAADMVALLKVAGIEVTRLVVYDQAALPLTAAAAQLLQGASPVLLPLFSPRSADLAAGAISLRAAPIWLVAISPAVATAAELLSPDRQMIASSPDAPGVLGALAALIDAARG